MTSLRGTKVTGIAVAAALVLAACGSDDNTDQTGIDVPDVDCSGAETINASGSSAQSNAMIRFINVYEAACDDQFLNYNSSGSGAGLNEFLGGQTNFAGSDIPLKEELGEVSDARERCGGNEGWNLPLVFTSIAVTYNVAGVDDLALDGPTLAQIFNGTITEWDDPRIAELNEDVDLPDEEITVIFRSDEAGTTDNFQQYLEAAGGDAWTEGTGKLFQGGVGEGAEGNENTSSAVNSTPGSITYNEWSFARQQDMPTADVVNSGGGDPIELNEESAARTINNVEVAGDGNDLELDLDSLFDTEIEGAYPIVLVAYEIVCSEYPDPEVGEAVKTFLNIAATHGQQGLADRGFVPLPDDFRDRLLNSIEAIS